MKNLFDILPLYGVEPVSYTHLDVYKRQAQDYIQSKVIDVAKERIFDRSKSVNQIAYDLGFKYPQHFTRLFKQRVGHSPNEYRNLN